MIIPTATRIKFNGEFYSVTFDQLDFNVVFLLKDDDTYIVFPTPNTLSRRGFASLILQKRYKSINTEYVG